MENKAFKYQRAFIFTKLITVKFYNCKNIIIIWSLKQDKLTIKIAVRYQK